LVENSAVCIPIKGFFRCNFAVKNHIRVHNLENFYEKMGKNRNFFSKIFKNAVFSLN